MRRYRMGLIQTAEQLRFSYLSIIEGAESMNIDLRRWIPPHLPGSTSCSDSDSDSEDDSDNPEEVEEEDDVASSETINFNQGCNVQRGTEEIIGNQEINSTNDSEELPPPIPPRAESLVRPGNDIRFERHIHALFLMHFFFFFFQIMTALFLFFHRNGLAKRWKYILLLKPKKTLRRATR